MRRLVLAALLAIGCGSGGSEPDNPLADTTWAVAVSGAECEMGFDFADTPDYFFGFVCILNTGQTAGVIEYGNYWIDGDTLTMTATRTSCPQQTVVTVSYRFATTPSSLTIIEPTRATTFARLPGGFQGPAPGQLLIGCFDDQLVFTEQPVTTL